MIFVLYEQIPLAIVGFILLSTIDRNGTTILVIEREGHRTLHVRRILRDKPRLEAWIPIGIHMVYTDICRCRTIIQHIIGITIHHWTSATAYTIVLVYWNPLFGLSHTTCQIGIERVFQQ